MDLTFETIHMLTYESPLARTMILEIFKHYPEIKVTIMEEVDVVTEDFARQLFYIVKEEGQESGLTS